MSDLFAPIAEVIEKAERVLLATHVNPDGDAVGSVAALGSIATAKGCEVRLYFVSGIPSDLAWLPLPAPHVERLEDLGDFVPDLVIAADCGDAARLGPELAQFFKGEAFPSPAWEGAVTANIDHHVGNPEFARINFVDPTKAATGEIVGLLAEHMGVPLSGDLGVAVYLALVADTGGFSFSNTGADVLALAARVAAAGLDVAAFTALYENNWELARMKLWGRLFSEVALHAEGRIAACVVPESYLNELGLGKSDLEGFAGWLRKLKGVKVGLFIREDAPGRCKISLRSMGDVDVRRTAAFFGGGGHKAAAGAEAALGPKETLEAVLEKLTEDME